METGRKLKVSFQQLARNGQPSRFRRNAENSDHIAAAQEQHFELTEGCFAVDSHRSGQLQGGVNASNDYAASPKRSLSRSVSPRKSPYPTCRRSHVAPGSLSSPSTNFRSLRIPSLAHVESHLVVPSPTKPNAVKANKISIIMGFSSGPLEHSTIQEVFPDSPYSVNLVILGQNFVRVHFAQYEDQQRALAPPHFRVINGEKLSIAPFLIPRKSLPAPWSHFRPTRCTKCSLQKIFNVPQEFEDHIRGNHPALYQDKDSMYKSGERLWYLCPKSRKIIK
eukprot:268306_1